MNEIVNASPQYVEYGTDDQSIKSLPPMEIVVPTHIPKFYDFFQKGITGKSQLVDSARMLSHYGSESFTSTSKFYNNNKMFMSALGSAGNGAFMIHRLMPSDVTSISNMTIYLDIIEDLIPVYKRNIDGSITTDVNGDPVEDTTGPITGYRVKLIKEVDVVPVGTRLGEKTSKTGTMVDANSVTSTMYPIREVFGKYFGEAYNKVGMAISLPSISDVNTDFIEATKTLPYEMYLYNKVDGVDTISKDLYGSVKNSFVFKPQVKDPVTSVSLSINDAYNYWYNETSSVLSLRYPDLENIYIYDANLETVLNKLVAAEANYINTDITTNDDTVVNTSEWFDFVSSDDLADQTYLLNAFNCYSTSRVPYFGSVIDESVVTLAENQTEIMDAYNVPTYLGNGMDGTVSEANLESAMGVELDKYLDENSEVMDSALNVENIMYDTGFSLDIKTKLINFISVRKNTFVMLSTRQNTDTTPNDLVTDRAIAINLKSRIGLAPESVRFGTPAARGMVIMGAGKIINGLDNNYYPLTYELGIKSAKMMGGASWKAANIFDKGEDNIIDSMYDITPGFIPQGVKPSLWNLGVVWAQPYDLKRMHFPSLQTVYTNDTSVLNNYFAAIALTVISNVAGKTWRAFTGVTTLSPDELIDEVELYAAARLNVFADMIKVVPKAIITDYDSQSGYSWTLQFRMGANVSRTVMQTYTIALRMEDL